MKGWKRWVGALLVGTALAAGAQPFPSKPIRIIVPFAAGGPSDRLARDVATWDPILKTLGTRIQ